MLVSWLGLDIKIGLQSLQKAERTIFLDLWHPSQTCMFGGRRWSGGGGTEVLYCECV